MPALSNPKHERFARFRARGFNQRESYLKAGYLSGNAANASKLDDRPEVLERIEQLMEESAPRRDLSRDELVSFLESVINDSESKRSDQLRAVEILAKLTGRAEPEILEVKGQMLSSIVNSSVLEELTAGYLALHADKKDK